MSFTRIKALMFRYIMLLKHDLGKIMDSFYWPLIDIVAWGFLTIYFNKTPSENNYLGKALLSAVILWTIVYTVARDIAISFLDDMWDRNVLHVYGSPLKPSEFLTASFLIAVGRVVLVIAMLTVIAFLFYSFNLFILGIYFGLAFLTLVLFAFAIGVFAVALIMRFGPGVEIFAWSVPAIISPISGVFYPISVLPSWLKIISYFFPTSYVFEGMRQVLTIAVVPWENI